MLSTLNSRRLRRSSLTRLLQTTGLSLALVTASAAGVHAEDVTVQGANGANGENGVNPGDDGQSGGGGGAAVANAGSIDPITSTLNRATAFGGSGGKGGDLSAVGGAAGFGGPGGAATATAATTIISGSSEADAASTGGNGGSSGFALVAAPFFANGGQGGVATVSATASTGGGNVTASALATGGNGGVGDGVGGTGGDANASGRARTTGSGDALSSANATGGEAGEGFDIPGLAGNATARADASAAGGGKAIATALATVGFGELVEPVANATSNAVTANGAMAQALSTAAVQTPFPGSGRFVGQASSTAKTSFEGVTATAAAISTRPTSAATSEAIAQGGSGQTSPTSNVDVAGISTAVPDKAYATTLIGGAGNVAGAFQGPGDEIFGTSTLELGSSTFDFRYQGDLLLGVIDGFDFDIIVNGAQVFAGDSLTDTVINLGSNFGPNIDLTINGFGDFVIGGAVPETVPEASTWAMLVLGFAGLGLVGYRQTRGAKPQTA
jgi:hypothetical protein